MAGQGWGLLDTKADYEAVMIKTVELVKVGWTDQWDRLSVQKKTLYLVTWHLTGVSLLIHREDMDYSINSDGTIGSL